MSSRFANKGNIFSELTQIAQKLPFLIMRKLSLKKDCFRTIRSGVLRNVRWSMDVRDLDYLLGTYEFAGISALVQNLRTGDSFYDIGANVGYYSIAASKIVGEKGIVFSFEPLPKNVQLLRKHLKVNKIENVYPIEYAVSNKRGNIEFSNSNNLAANTYVATSGIYNNESTIAVKSVTIDDFVESNSAPLPDFIKIDVEGAESDVLEGALMTLQVNYPHILLATHDRNVPGVKDKCLQYLKSHGYQWVALKEKKPLTGQKDFLAFHPERMSVD